MIICGIDPGATGALAFLDTAGEELVHVADMPVIEVKVGGKLRKRLSPGLLVAVLREHGADHAFLENVTPRPKEGSAASFAFGRGFGVIEGALAAIGVATTLITPAVWKRAAGLPADKGVARMRAAQLWPIHAAMFARVRDDGRAEASLLARHGAQVLHGATPR